METSTQLGCSSCGGSCNNSNQRSVWADFSVGERDAQIDLTDVVSLRIINTGDVAATIGDHILIETGDERSICAAAGTVFQKGSKKLKWADTAGLKKLVVEKIFVETVCAKK